MSNVRKFIEDLKRVEKELQYLPTDVAVMAADLFDLNFKNESFFGKKWTPSKYVQQENLRAEQSRHLLHKSGNLRRSIRYNVHGNIIEFYSNMPYAGIHNEGGVINHPGGTAFFKKKGETIWVSKRKAAGKNYPKTKPHKISIPQRQFVGEHPQLDREVETLIDDIFKGI